MDIWKTVCTDCNGICDWCGGHIENGKHDCYEPTPCPTCEGSGYMMLVVEGTYADTAKPSIHNGSPTLRPLSSKEVEEIATPIVIIKTLEMGFPVFYKGSQVRLTPYRKG